MIRQTGGFALLATSTRSRSMSLAIWSASGVGRTPSFSPSGPTSKTSRERIRSLILASGFSAMTDHCAMADPFHRALCREEPGQTRSDTKEWWLQGASFADPAHPQVAGRARDVPGGTVQSRFQNKLSTAKHRLRVRKTSHPALRHFERPERSGRRPTIGQCNEFVDTRRRT
jgi:hypothetical protein